MASSPPNPNGRTPNGDAAGSKRSAAQASLELARDDSKKQRFHGCSPIKHYIIMSKLGEGTFGEVHKAESRVNGQIFALKKILMHQEKDGFPVTALREIKLLKMLCHPNVLKLEEMAMERPREGRKKATVYMVTPYMDHDLSGLLENPSVQFTEATIKCYMLQLLEGVAYLHRSKILHRDMKAANLLINNEGILQIADFGLARPYDDPPPLPGKGNGDCTRPYTTVVVTRWYRPPELLLQLRYYTPAIDIWGVGCVFAEMFKKRPILAGNSDVDQIHKIFDLVGSPTEDNMPGWSSLPGCDGVKTFQHRHSRLSQEFRDQGSLFISLLGELMRLDWRKRINALDALEHPYFKNEPLPVKPGDIPHFQESHELDRRKFREQKANPPPAPAGGTVGMGPDGDFGSGAIPNNNGYTRPRGGTAGYPHDGSYPPRRNDYGNRNYPPLYDNRGPPPPPAGPPPPPSRRPAWAQEAGLPPRPPPTSNMGYGGGNRPHSNSRDRPHQDSTRSRPRGGVGGVPNVDTYIPDYAGRDEGRGRDDGRRGHDEGYRSRDDGQRRDERGDRRGGDRRDHEDRDRKRRRSRSPDRDRDRQRERDRELYRR